MRKEGLGINIKVILNILEHLTSESCQMSQGREPQLFSYCAGLETKSIGLQLRKAGFCKQCFPIMERLIFCNSEISINMLECKLPTIHQDQCRGDSYWKEYCGCFTIVHIISSKYFFLSTVVCCDNILKLLKICSDFLTIQI